MDSAVRSVRSLVLVECGVELCITSGAELSLTLRRVNDPPPVDPQPVAASVSALAFVLDDFEKRVLEVVRQSSRITGKTLAKRMNMQDTQEDRPNSKLRGTLTRLTAVCILTNDDDGYVISAEFRPLADQIFSIKS